MRDLLKEARMERNRNERMAIATAVAVAISFAAAAQAADGVLEINQACVATGCFPGDAPGFPVLGQASKSYVLTSNLIVPNGTTSAVLLNDFATLDLGGFSIIGTTVCTGVLVAACTGGSSTSYGVQGGSSLTIRNGVIRNRGTHGIRAGKGTLVVDMLIQENRNDGIAADNGSGWVIRNSRVLRNGRYGIDFSVAGAYALITGNVIDGNALDGVRGTGLLLLDNAMANNGADGINVFFSGQQSALARNVLNYNNGGNDQDQISGGLQIGINVCASDTTCP
jgi:hypothetical protein